MSDQEETTYAYQEVYRSAAASPGTRAATLAFRAIWGAMPLPRDWRGQTKGAIRAPIPRGAPQRTREHGRKTRAKGKRGRRR